ncbi:protein of unknown function - conserved [Leishmania donovani]|uniref:Uncharacterized protein n=3 Tax=Leishmania donovani species complex TaxID=38574 RepID=A4I4Y1_LEIIN|nr:conserved hypothetical protein [Leishmania infantum JPCM5]CAC9510900.1 hypothetical_protein_-_conserved [Leishmania infantum]CAJ1990780.1 protein of unknown function - conserved [Leishmania donovani]CAM69849.1 conserved hypothetical protein [Leishmania infantum JPCM5]SUZ43810.1 hypothetical_protein_-_conserved [Leishmania infantum]VDZ46631.1 hypothetical_protein_conserved [Leishmania donovani]|eukprot:XP_001466800.1 conserved hypothetical protein [Leishmania infantum JPCM5]
MPPLYALFRATASAVVGSALASAHYAQRASALTSSVVEGPDAGTADAVASMRLQDQTIPWEIECDDFRHGYQANTVQLQILRLRAEYAASSGEKSPVIRIVGFFPGVASKTVYEHLTNVTLRRGWDCNYTNFEQFSGKCPSTLAEVDALQRPFAAVANVRPCCSGDVCTLVPDVAGVVLDDHGWFTHRVGGPLLRRFGLADRLFQYERLTYEYYFGEGAAVTSTGAATASKMYDVLFSGSKRTREAASTAAPPLRAWLQANREAVPCEEVDMNFQHILLVPIADAEAQLFRNSDQLRSLCTMGSMIDVTSTKLVYDVWKDTQQRVLDGAASSPGTLLIMSSANNVGIPALLPRWAQKTILSTMSHKAYGYLLKACQEYSSHQDSV